MASTKWEKTDHIYLQVAEGIEQMINDDVFRIGDKLPSVRMLSEENGISMGTAFQAYYHLEGKGLIESRPKSGYYVRFNQNRFPALPDIKPSVSESGEVTIKEMINSIYSDIAGSGKVLNLALGAPDPSLLPLAKLNKSVVQALRESPDHCVSYASTQGHPELRKQLSRLSFNWGGKIKPEDILVTGGCLEAITFCLRAVTKPGDTIAIECPNYFGFYQAAESMGLKVVEISSDPTTGLDIDQLHAAIKKFPLKACVLVPNFNNPHGSLMPDENKKRLVELVTRYRIPLIEDDIYGELFYGKTRPATCKTFDKKGWVMYCSSFSKSLAPGYRVGWTIPGRFMEEVKQLKRIHDISSPSITQAALAHFLAKGRYEFHLKGMRKALHTQSLRYVQAIITHFPPNTKVSRPQGGFVLWVELDKKVNGFKLRAEAMKHQISIVPGKIFSSACDYSNFIRISFAKPFTREVEEGLQVLGRLAKK